MEHTKYLGINPYQIPVKVLPSVSECNRCIDASFDFEPNGPDCSICKIKHQIGYLIQTESHFGTTYGIVVFENGKIERISLSQIEALDVPKLSINPFEEE